MSVTLDTFSGNPNPTWKLSKQEQEEFLRKLDRLRKINKIQKFDGLGYRGMIIEMDNEITRRYEIKNGIIEGKSVV